MSIDVFVKAHATVIVSALVSALLSVFGYRVIEKISPDTGVETLSQMQTQLSNFQSQITVVQIRLDSLRTVPSEVRALVTTECVKREWSGADVGTLPCNQIIPDYRTERRLPSRRR